jgi:hypothetical protein
MEDLMSGREFDDIDDINKFFNGEPTTPAPTFERPQIDRTKAIHEPAPETVASGFTEKCRHCRGTGHFTAFTGRILGPCFKCNGKGEINFKTSPQARAKARANHAVKTANRDAEKAAWREQHKDLISWIHREDARFLDGKTTFDFPHKMAEALVEFGWLTDGQRSAVEKCKAKSDERRANFKAHTSDIDASKIAAAFDHAREAAADDGDFVRNLRLRFDGFSFSPDRRNPAVIWVNSDSVKNNRGFPAALGKIEAGKFSKFRLCDDATRDQIATVAADPGAAASAHGLRFKYCACCGRELTNEESRTRGIGPICAEKFGF